MQPNNELTFISSSFDKKQRELLIFLLTEEKENIERFKEQNLWVAERVEVIDSLLQMIDQK